MMTPRVSVIMLTYNRPQFIGNAIGSILAQQFQDWELLVVHDGPNQQIPIVMADWEKRDPRVQAAGVGFRIENARALKSSQRFFELLPVH